eukprot:TRINITY_DN19549_c0_g1_i1.p1 TRINITY_DN19549_c0_g1~~TRINITY_DN19549_c0_g1_i1.p1  ORF type:complete len:1593 (+),score=406.59 TRINITY_DN19549_c0_g1_i1:160-4938(+)
MKHLLSALKSPTSPTSPKFGARSDKWAGAKVAMQITSAMKRHKRERRLNSLSPAAIAKHGVTPSSLLHVLTNETFDDLREVWHSLHGPAVDPEHFGQLMRPLLIESEYFNADGSIKNRDDDGDCDEGSGASNLSPLDNYIKELFLAVDKSRTGVATWDAFVNFLIDETLGDTFARRAGRQQQQTYQYRGAAFGTSSEDVGTAHSALYYFEGWNKLVGIVRRRVRVCECAHLATNPQVVKTLEHPAWVLCAEYAPNAANGPNVLFTSCADLKVRVWLAATGHHLPVLSQLRTLTLPQSVQAMKYDASSGHLIAGDREGCLMMLDLERSQSGHGLQQKQDTPFDIAFKTQAHEPHCALTAITLLPDDHIVTAGLDGRVLNHSPERGMACSAYDTKSGHKKGVLHMAVVPQFRFIITGGFEPHALCWIDNTPSIPAFRLEDINNPHSESLAGLVTVPGTPLVGTVDTTGSTKIFDVRTFQVVEQFNVRHHAPFTHVPISAVCYTGSRNRQLVYGARQLFIFEHDSKSSDVPLLAHSWNHPLFFCQYLPGHCRQFCSVAAGQIRLWSTDTGLPTATYAVEGKGEITAADVDARPPGKVVLGHSCGAVTARSAVDGSLVREYRWHGSAITAVTVCTSSDLIATAAADGAAALWTDVDTPLYQRITAGTLVPLVLKRKGIVSITDEVRLRQLPGESLMDFWSNKKTGDQSRAVVARIRNNIEGRKVAAEYRRRDDQRKGADAGGTSPSAERPAGGRPQEWSAATELVVRNPVGRLQLNAPGRCLCFHKADWLLVVAERKTAYVHELGSGPQTWGARGPPLRHRLRHSPGSELLCGAFLEAEGHERPLVIVGEASGMVHIWSIVLSVPVCITRWYNTPKPRQAPAEAAPPQPPSADWDTEGSSSESDDQCAAKAQQRALARRKLDDEAAADLLSRLRHGKLKKGRKPIVAAVTCLQAIQPHFVFAADALGNLSCWDAEWAMDIADRLKNATGMQGLALGSSPLQCDDTEMQPPTLIFHQRVHQDAILSLVHTQAPAEGLIATGADQSVTMSALDGQLLATLRQGPVHDQASRWTLIHTSAELRGRPNRLRVRMLWHRLRRYVRKGEWREPDPEPNLPPCMSQIQMSSGEMKSIGSGCFSIASAGEIDGISLVSPVARRGMSARAAGGDLMRSPLSPHGHSGLDAFAGGASAADEEDEGGMCIRLKGPDKPKVKMGGLSPREDPPACVPIPESATPAAAPAKQGAVFLEKPKVSSAVLEKLRKIVCTGPVDRRAQMATELRGAMQGKGNEPKKMPPQVRRRQRGLTNISPALPTSPSTRPAIHPTTPESTAKDPPVARPLKKQIVLGEVGYGKVSYRLTANTTAEAALLSTSPLFRTTPRRRARTPGPYGGSLHDSDPTEWVLPSGETSESPSCFFHTIPGGRSMELDGRPRSRESVGRGAALQAALRPHAERERAATAAGGSRARGPGQPFKLPAERGAQWSLALDGLAKSRSARDARPLQRVHDIGSPKLLAAVARSPKGSRKQPRPRVEIADPPDPAPDAGPAPLTPRGSAAGAGCAAAAPAAAGSATQETRLSTVKTRASVASAALAETLQLSGIK